MKIIPKTKKGNPKKSKKWRQWNEENRRKYWQLFIWVLDSFSQNFGQFFIFQFGAIFHYVKSPKTINKKLEKKWEFWPNILGKTSYEISLKFVWNAFGYFFVYFLCNLTFNKICMRKIIKWFCSYYFQNYKLRLSYVKNG